MHTHRSGALTPIFQQKNEYHVLGFFSSLRRDGTEKRAGLKQITVRNILAICIDLDAFDSVLQNKTFLCHVYSKLFEINGILYCNNL
jgi:hypothetical protein